jgi:phenylacetate-CoA ligase
MEKTSGTTGTALHIYRPHAMQPKWWALYELCRNVAGVAWDIPYASLGGRPVVPGDTQRPPYWRFNRRWHHVYLSSYHVSAKTATGYITAMRQYGTQWIEGYGSAIAALAENALAAGVPPLPLRAAIVSGDTLLPGMRVSIEQFFQCKCYDHYAQSEGVCMAMECPYGRMHLLPAAGIVEIVRDDGTPCAPGEVGEIVATGLLNDAMPLIRYRLGDYAAWAQEQDCPCGNVHPVLANLEGRVDDYLITADGRTIGRLSTAVKRSPTIHSAQIVQDRPSHAYLLVRPGQGYRPADAVAVCDDIRERIGTFEIEIIEVSEIPKTPQGKTILVVRLADRPAMRDLYTTLLKP